MVDLSQTDLGERVRRLEKYTLPGGQPGPETVTADESTATALTPAPEPAGVGGALAEGQVLADDGELYDTPEAARDAATDYILLGIGTFDSGFTVNKAGLTVQGCGPGTVLAAPDNASDSLVVTAGDVWVDSLRVVGPRQLMVDGGGNAWFTNLDIGTRHGIQDGFPGVSGTTIANCRFNTQDEALYINGGNCMVNSCTFLNSGRAEFRGNNAVVQNSHFRGGSGFHAIRVLGASSIASGNFVETTASTSTVQCGGDDVIVSDNWVHNLSADAGTAGIEVLGTNDLIANNHAHADGGTALDTASATTPTLDANITS